jgi:hypothetical protein
MYSVFFLFALFDVGEDKEEEGDGGGGTGPYIGREEEEGDRGTKFAPNDGGGTGPYIGELLLVFCRLAGGEVGELFVPVLIVSFVLFFPASSSKVWRTRAFNPAPPLFF